MKTHKVKINRNLIKWYAIIWFTYAGLRFVFNWLEGFNGAVSSGRTFNFDVFSPASFLLLLMWVFLNGIVVFRFLTNNKSAWSTMAVVGGVISILLLGPFLVSFSAPFENLDIIFLFLVNVFNAVLGFLIKEKK